jgi:hypothetical protein
VQFCEDTVIPSKEVRIFSNNKPWITKDLKHCLNEKKAAFLKGDEQKVRELEKEFRRKARAAKLQYKNKVEEKFAGGMRKRRGKG